MRRRPGGRHLLLVALAALLMTLGGAGSALAAGGGRLSFTQVQPDFECTICHEPLNEARSDEAYEENGVLRGLIAQGDTLPQVKRAMVAQYGEAVLSTPPAHGFNLLAWIIPGAVIAAGLALLAYLIPRWRSRGRRDSDDDAGPGGSAERRSRISEADAARLNAELARTS